MDKGIQIRVLLPEEAPAPVCPALDKNQAPGEKWYDEEGEESQLDIENQHDEAHADKLNKVGEQCENALVEQFFKGVDIPDDPSQDLSGRPLVKVAK